MKNTDKFFNIIKKKVINGSPEIQRFVESRLVREGRMSISHWDKFIGEYLTIRYFDTSVLVWFAQALEEFDPKLCKVSEFFEEVEITNSKMYIYPVETVSKHLTIHNVVEIAENQYLGTMSIEQICMLRRNRVIQAHFEAQRDSATLKYGDREIKVIKINDDRVEEIMDKIDANEYAYNTIRVNVTKDASGLPEIKYNSKLRTIKLDPDALNLIIDGNHRSIACERLPSRSPERMSFYKQKHFAVLITNETILGCKKTITQEWNTEPVSDEQIKSMERSDANRVIEMIMASDLADPIYSKKIVNTKEEIRIGNGFILLPVLSDAIEAFYDTDSIKTMSGKQKLKDWLIAYFNEVADTFKDDFENHIKIRNFRWTVSTYTCYVHIYLSSILKDNNKWEEVLRSILNRIDWDIKAYPFKEILSSKNKLKHLTKMFTDSLIKEG